MINMLLSCGGTHVMETHSHRFIFVLISIPFYQVFLERLSENRDFPTILLSQSRFFRRKSIQEWFYVSMCWHAAEKLGFSFSSLISYDNCKSKLLWLCQFHGWHAIFLLMFEGRNTVDGYVLGVQSFSFMCTIHIDMTAHTST